MIWIDPESKKLKPDKREEPKKTEPKKEEKKEKPQNRSTDKIANNAMKINAPNGREPEELPWDCIPLNAKLEEQPRATPIVPAYKILKVERTKSDVPPGALLGILKWMIKETRKGDRIEGTSVKELEKEMQSLNEMSLALKIARKRIDQLEDDYYAETPWRSGTVLPEHDQPVLVALRWKDDGARDYSLGYCCQSEWYLIRGRNPPSEYDIIAWMPLPDLPE